MDQAFGALLDFRLAEWQGLPPCLAADIARLLGPPSTASDGYLGTYPAHCETYPVPSAAAKGLIVYARANRVVAVETIDPPPVAATHPLGPPDIRLAPEFSVPGYIVGEHLYYRRGLVLSVAEAGDAATQPQVKIARCRGIPILGAPHQYGAEYYLARGNRMVFD